MTRKRGDIREIFRGDDPGRIVRGFVRELSDAATKRGLEKERERAVYRYENKDEIAVIVSRVRDDPPLWRMETVSPVVPDSGKCQVLEMYREHLEPELRIEIARTLLRHGVVETWAEARAQVHRLPVSVRAVVLLRDSQKFETDGNVQGRRG